jgi:hypothetical protein
MKKLLILVLLVALGAGAYLSKPAEPAKSFTHYLVNHEGRDADEAAMTVATCEVADHLFWVDIKQDGKSVYTSAFHHWFNRAEVKHAVKQDVKAAERTAERTIEKVKEKVSGN